MTDTTRSLIIKLTSHMTYMQGQLEAHHELDDLEDYYWYRESVALLQQVADALAADGPAVPEGREPAAPLSLKAQALAVIENSEICDHLSPEHAAILRRALEALPND